MIASPKKSLSGIALILFLVAADQVSKWWVLEFLIKPTLGNEPIGFISWLLQDSTRLPYTEIPVFSFFNIVMVWNDGISFGLFDSMGVPLLTIGTLLIAGIFAIWLMRSRRWAPILALSMVVGGALGNLVDRFRVGAVADFLDFHLMGWHYPAFNLADSCITLGIVLLIVDNLFWEPKS